MASATGHVQLACVSWFLYDWAISLAAEVSFIASRRPLLVKAVYLFMRYVTLAMLIGECVVYVALDNLSSSACNHFGAVRTAVTIILLAAAHGAMLYRTFLLCNQTKSRWRIYLDAAFGALACVGAAVVVGVFSSRIRVDASDNVDMCASHISRALVAFLTPPLCFAIYLVASAAWTLPFPTSVMTPMILLCVAEITAIALLATSAITPGDAVTSIVHAACAISSTRLLRIDSTLQSESMLPTAAQYELGSVHHHRPKDSYWSENAMLSPAELSPTETKHDPEHFHTITLVPAEHIAPPPRPPLPLVTRLVTHAQILPDELDAEGDAAAADDDADDFGIVGGSEMNSMSPDVSPRSAKPHPQGWRGSMASLGALTAELHGA